MDEMNEAESPGSATCSTEGGRSVVTVAGEFDVANAHVLRQALATAAGPVVLDARDLRFIDSSGLAVLLQHAESAGAIEIRNAPTMLRRIVSISGLGHLLRIGE